MNRAGKEWIEVIGDRAVAQMRRELARDARPTPLRRVTRKARRVAYRAPTYPAGKAERQFLLEEALHERMWRCRDLADMYGVSVWTIQDDIRELRARGVRIDGSRGPGGGVMARRSAA